MDSMKEECGVVGVIGDAEAANLVYLGLYALQHRGQEACGIVTASPETPEGTPAPDGRFYDHKSFGLVSDGIDRDILSELPGTSGIGHVRYSTYGGRLFQNVQPFFFRTSIGRLAIAHNGNLTNATAIRRELEIAGSIFQSTSDTEVFMHLIARSQKQNLRERIAEAMAQVKGAYSLVVLSKDRLFAIRDPFGFRPLVLGRRGNAHIVASETCVFDLIEAEFLREVEPGEIVEIDVTQKISSYYPLQKRKSAYCSFEPIYFARPDSRLFGSDEMYYLRRQIGHRLFKEAPAKDAAIVIAIPDSGLPMAYGYAEASRLPFEMGLIRNHYVGRTFIEPSQAIRDFGVRLKLNPVKRVLKDRSVVVVDDSIVRGTTAAKIIKMLRRAGASKIHFRIGSPPITDPCYFGIDTPEKSSLLASRMTVEEIRQFVGADTLAFLSLEGLKQALGEGSQKSFCYACFTGVYPEETPPEKAT